MHILYNIYFKCIPCKWSPWRWPMGAEQVGGLSQNKKLCMVKCAISWINYCILHCTLTYIHVTFATVYISNDDKSHNFIILADPHPTWRWQGMTRMCWAKMHCAHFLWEKQHCVNANIYKTPIPHHLDI